jgi:hypothetical protein
MAVHVVVPEGLGYRPAGDDLVLSAYFQAVLESVARVAKPGDRVYMSPGNPFGGAVSEEVMAADILLGMRPDLDVVVPERRGYHRYLDTLDNARELRRWLQGRGEWPLPPIRLHSYAQHRHRSRLVFRLEGYVVEHAEPVRDVALGPRPVGRLWYMGFPLLHELYEGVATLYDLARWGWKKIEDDA